jgi:cyclopropane-fatty-acyl-phospholipid synthase
VPEKANEQHYEVPPRLFELVLGKHLKYSSGIWNDGCDTLDQSEQDMLALTIQRAELKDNIDILEL